MWFLVAASIIWGFSFGIIGQTLSDLPSAWTSAVRLAVAGITFAPFVRRTGHRLALSLIAVGALQFGLMYWAYMASFRYLQSYEVVLFTVTTPLFVTILNDLMERRFYGINHLAALLAVVGACAVKWQGKPGNMAWLGVLLVQFSNLCFAAGQLGYRACFKISGHLRDHNVMFWPYLGGFVVMLPLAAHQKPAAVSDVQITALLYLGIVASGVGFFLWNAGARRVQPLALAVANNLKIPLAVTISLLFFGERVNLVSLLAGSLLILAALLPARRTSHLPVRQENEP